MLLRKCLYSSRLLKTNTWQRGRIPLNPGCQNPPTLSLGANIPIERSSYPKRFPPSCYGNTVVKLHWGPVLQNRRNKRVYGAKGELYGSTSSPQNTCSVLVLQDEPQTKVHIESDTEPSIPKTEFPRLNDLIFTIKTKSQGKLWVV